MLKAGPGGPLFSTHLVHDLVERSQCSASTSDTWERLARLPLVILAATWDRASCRTAEFMESLLKEVPISWVFLMDRGELLAEAELPAEEGREGGREGGREDGPEEEEKEEEEEAEEAEERSNGTLWSPSADL